MEQNLNFFTCNLIDGVSCVPVGIARVQVPPYVPNKTYININRLGWFHFKLEPKLTYTFTF